MFIWRSALLCLRAFSCAPSPTPAPLFQLPPELFFGAYVLFLLSTFSITPPDHTSQGRKVLNISFFNDFYSFEDAGDDFLCTFLKSFDDHIFQKRQGSFISSAENCCDVAKPRKTKRHTSIKTLARFFHLPIALAGERLGMCPTMLKRICRANNITKWPYRKLLSIDKAIVRLGMTRVSGSRSHELAVAQRITDLCKQKREISFDVPADL